MSSAGGLINPNTRTCATFRSRRDAELTKAIYRRVPVLIREEPLENPWGISFLRMFDMSNDSHLFRTREQLEGQGFRLEGNRYVGSAGSPQPSDSPQPPAPSPKGRRGEDSPPPESIDSPLHLGEGLGVRAFPPPPEGANQGLEVRAADKRVYLPLYEAKMIHQFDHRAADVVLSETALVRQGQPDTLSNEDKSHPERLVMPRYWAADHDIQKAVTHWTHQWFTGWRDVTSVTNERTLVSAIIPWVGAGDKFLLMLPSTSTG